MRRADAFMLTRSDQIPAERRSELEGLLRMWNPQAPVYRARHAHTGLRTVDNGQNMPVEELAHRRFFAFAGIGQPGGLGRQLSSFGENYCGHYWFGDHHHYNDDDLMRMRRQAKDAGADVLLVTEKDWVKIRGLQEARGGGIPIWRLEVQIEMEEKAEAGLLELIETRVDKARER
jgi:tetraacyldisaccharide 4'-kinase